MSKLIKIDIKEFKQETGNAKKEVANMQFNIPDDINLTNTIFDTMQEHCDSFKDTVKTYKTALLTDVESIEDTGNKIEETDKKLKNKFK